LLLLLLLLLRLRRWALTLAVHRWRRRRVHGRQRLAGDGRKGGRTAGSGGDDSEAVRRGWTGAAEARGW
jgi:hypothetical protein